MYPTTTAPVQLDEIKAALLALAKAAKAMKKEKSPGTQESATALLMMIEEMSNYLQEKKAKIQKEYDGYGTKIKSYLKELSIEKSTLIEDGEMQFDLLRSEAEKHVKGPEAKMKKAAKGIMEILDEMQSFIDRENDETKSRFGDFKVQFDEHVDSLNRRLEKIKK